MRSRAALMVVLAIAALLTASPAIAQITQGRVTGLVTDTQGAVLPGATVTATSPALIGNQTTVSQPDGRYLFPALPTGAYKIVFERDALRFHPEFECRPEKNSCSKMTSCAEAFYHLEKCSVPNMDGDRDGIPCERQWCN